MSYTLDIYNTHMELYPYKLNDLPYIEKQFTAFDQNNMKYYPCGYIIQNNKLYLPRGASVEKITSLLNIDQNYVSKSDPMNKMSRVHDSLYEPRNDLQSKSIEFLMSDDNPQLGLNLATGIGKTFCVAYASTKLKEKTIIITPNETLKSQWIKTYYTMFDYKKSELINVAGSPVMSDIIKGDIKPAEVYFVNHQTLRSFLTNNGETMLHKFFKTIKVGIKVYDESHLEFANIILMDFFTNTKKTWYLTATFDRSDKSESQCFKRAFSSVSTFGEKESEEVVKKHVIYHVVRINSKATFKSQMKINRFGRMTGASYGHYAFLDDVNNTAYNSIKLLMEKVKDVEGKILIFIPLIEAVDNTVIQLQKDFPDKSIGGYHSKLPKSEKLDNLKKDVIISTIKSLGTGKDIPGLRALICAEPITSKVGVKQLFGRLRPYAEDKSTYFFDIVDISIPMINIWWKCRYKTIQSLAKDVIHLEFD